ncbi:2303_t:CDS:2 [Paraglomus brasilianum]|uniref:2303_t:CDS:1 n=1 Tax=Paraglomus brasilianum TaxID=144538 RepID=A0A9N9CFT1_9GLOM|nr:2303_t:CDS:2 [Paraglomus brasilianum]
MDSTYVAPECLQKVDEYFKKTPVKHWHDFATFAKKQPSNTVNSILSRYCGSLIALSDGSAVPEKVRNYCRDLHKAATTSKKECFKEIAKHVIKVKTVEDRIVRLEKELLINAKLVSGSHVAVALDNWNPEDVEEAQDKLEEEHGDSAKLQEAQDKLEEEHENEPPDSISTPLDAGQLLIPNKRVIADQNIQSYMDDMHIIAADSMTPKELAARVGEERAKDIISARSTSPNIWTAVEKYVDSALQTKNTAFENSNNNDENLFKLYCKKVLDDFFNMVDISPNLSRAVGERKYLAYHVVPLFKFYERTFNTIDFDWAETHMSSAKMMKSAEDSGIILADAKGTRMLDGLEVWHLEIAGPPKRWTRIHILGDSKKTMRTDALNLLRILEDRLDCDVALASDIKVFSMLGIDTRITLYSLRMLKDGQFLATELATAIVPFSYNGRMQMKAVLRMMAIVHDELTKQEALITEIDRHVTCPEGKVTVQHFANLDGKSLKNHKLIFAELDDYEQQPSSHDSPYCYHRECDVYVRQTIAMHLTIIIMNNNNLPLTIRNFTMCHQPPPMVKHLHIKRTPITISGDHIERTLRQQSMMVKHLYHGSYAPHHYEQ